ncbi:MAG: hypothetical protein M5U09_19190 [Gammaproteobacteria bacterium]|nr:hypothetical protein [Gammaproteobacteria bacterium]
MPYTLHVISHSHWDREWYLPLELHRRRLVKLLDDVLDVLDRDPDFGSFHLDGQAIRWRTICRSGRSSVTAWWPRRRPAG